MRRAAIVERKLVFSDSLKVGERLSRDWRLLGRSAPSMVYGLDSLVVTLRSMHVRKYVCRSTNAIALTCQARVRWMLILDGGYRKKAEPLAWNLPIGLPSGSP